MNKKIISGTIATFMMMGAMPISAFSATDASTEVITATTNESIKVFKDGEYTVNVNALKTDGSGKESMSKQYLENPAHLYVENGKMKAEVKFNHSNFMSNHKVTVNGIDAVNFEKEELEGNVVKLTFDIDSLDDKIIVATTVMGTMNVSLQVVLLSDTLADRDGNATILN